MFSEIFGIANHIRTAFDRDPFASLFIRCKGCGRWDNAAFGNSCCPVCGCQYDGREDTQRCGWYPPGGGDQ